MTNSVAHLAFDVEQVLAQFNASQWFDRYWEVLSDENSRVNLVSRETTRERFKLIVAEALLPFTQFRPDAQSYLDIGSGGGIPAIPMLLSGAVTAPAVLYERTRKKATVLDRMLKTLGLTDVTVISESFGEQPLYQKFDLVTLSWVALDAQLFKSISAAMNPAAKLVYYSRPEFEIRDHEVSTFSYSQTADDTHKYFSIITK